MAAGADESPRGTAAPAHECGKGSAALLSQLQVLTPFNRRNLRLHPSAFEMPKLRSPPWGFFLRLPMALHSGNLPTDCLQAHNGKRVHYYFHSNEPLSILVPER
jgi:hypothetical protein